MSARPTSSELREWLRGLDALIFVEEPTVWAVTAIARELGVRVICVPNWEWLHPAQGWLNNVDLMLAPTRFTAEHLSSWKARYGFAWPVQQVPWPIDVQRFRFRRRYFCRRFVYVHGSGGAIAQCADSPQVAIRRKGLDVVLEAAAIANDVSIIVYGDRKENLFAPSNVEFRPQPHRNTCLYDDGDVCIQPSRWEGLGLPLIECQAAGMPLITTDAPPMQEHNPFALVPSENVLARLNSELHIPAACAQSDALASLLRSLRNRWIFAASGRARRFVEQEHAWSRRVPEIKSAIVAVMGSK